MGLDWSFLDFLGLTFSRCPHLPTADLGTVLRLVAPPLASPATALALLAEFPIPSTQLAHLLMVGSLNDVAVAVFQALALSMVW